MEDIKKNIRRVFWLYFLLFIVLQIYLTKFILFDSKTIMTNPNNPRLGILEKDIKRGRILDSEGEVLAESYKARNGDNIEYVRNYFKGKEFVHILGNVKKQKSGVESKYNFKMQRLYLDIYQRVKNIIFDDELIGNDVVLTIDSKFQKFVYETLGNNKGAIVAMEPSTGKILAMVSSPAYDPNKIDENWESLIKDDENSPLINRASKGLYPPGSVFKIITSLALIRNNDDYNDEFYECKGQETFNDTTIKCYNGNAHGKVNLEKAIAVSCNSYFVYNMNTKLKNQELINVCDKLYFNKSYNYPLEYSKSSFALTKDSDTSESSQTSIGQGKTLMTPLHIAVITSAFANGGIMMEPYIVDYIQTPSGNKVEKNVPKKINIAMTSEEADILSEMMTKVITEGTAVNASIKNITMAGKTGTAENATGVDHGLFTVFAPYEKPEIVVTVVLEKAGGSGKAVNMAREIMKYYFNK